ncbi:hypothetical protein GCM10010168_48490 [Actinoplanes ianthinogenes]|uniref:Uncharacterized protein n=2 Tax=Actinoplanes ianthinogenes TaxID=122358 RepID=A0ABM7LNP6_9ACTN|nr:hypothetical protein Aiant_15090 [Actinoplanes ianthinogenes]GGR24770.1 hypothetical protein GCM10010168_48490 [Actinoplanes ianthinogenes]
MLLKKGPSPQTATNKSAGATSGRLRETAPPPAFAPSRAYPPLTWSRPSVARSFADGLGVISRAMGAAVLLVATLVGIGLVIALLMTTVVRALGVDASSGY